MNILYHHRTQGTGAEGVHIAYIIKGFRTLGHQVDIISPHGREPETSAGDNPYARKKGLVPKLLDGLSRVLPQFLFELLELGYNIPAYLRLTQILRTRKVDFIYERSAFFLMAGARLAEKRKIPFLVEVNEVAGEKRVRRQCFVKLAQGIEKYVFDQADGIIVVSDFLKEKIKQLGVPEDKIQVFPNAADENIFNPSLYNGSLRQSLHLSQKTTVIGFIGWFVGWHQVELLLQAFASLASKKNLSLLLIGEGPLKERFQSNARELGVEGKVLFPGAVPYREIPRYIGVMDICVIPGSNEYRSPVKLFEYMAMGKPVVAPRLRPIESVIQHGIDGWLFEKDQPRSLRESLSVLIEDRHKREFLGQNARRKILEKHTWLKNAGRVVEMLDTIGTQ